MPCSPSCASRRSLTACWAYAQVSLGQYVAPGTAIVDLQRWDPMLLDFALPRELLGRLQRGQAVSFTTDAHPDRTFTAVGARVDADTRNIRVQATLPNADELLRPGLFGHASLALGDALSGVELPRAAVVYSTFGDTVYVVSDGELSIGSLRDSKPFQIFSVLTLAKLRIMLDHNVQRYMTQCVMTLPEDSGS